VIVRYKLVATLSAKFILLSYANDELVANLFQR